MALYISGLVSRATRLRIPAAHRLCRPQHLPRVLPFSPLSPKGPGRHYYYHLHHHRLTCPIIAQQQRKFSSTRPACEESTESTSPVALDALPICCPGCGAYTQTIEPDELGYYSESRRRKFSAEGQQKPAPGEQEVDNPDGLKDEGEVAAETIEKALRIAERNEGKAPLPKQTAMLDNAAETANRYIEASSARVPVCDRCHDLVHHNKAVSAPSPTIHTIREFLDESPYKENRIYHILDAADFPMSVIPNIHKVLSLQEQRSRNRRASDEKYRKGRKLPTITFVITRSDLLAATKEQVDSKMEYVRSVLRSALGRSAAEARLGNIYMVSAHRGWWTKNVKEEIRSHGQGIWVVGKANVGKSSFIEACFPKDSRNLEKLAELVDRRRQEGLDIEDQQQQQNQQSEQPPVLDPDSLLPPAPREDLYPVLPVVSSLRGTTVSPIRIPFGRGKGEMIDLPGLDRGQLEEYVRDEYKRDLIMATRPKPDRISIKPGQSLLLGGGLVRITAVDPTHTLTAACFVPLETHITNTEKAIEMQEEKRAYPKTKIAKDGLGEMIKPAGTFDLKWDVTRSHLPTSIAKVVEDKGVAPPKLPYQVMSADLLIEGCGWIELTVQFRSKDLSQEDACVPKVDVFSPKGQHIGFREPVECWEFIAKKRASDKRKRRPRGRQNIGLLKRTQSSS